MSRAGVRATVANFLAPPAVPGLMTVFRGAPTVIQGEEWAPVVEGDWGAAGYVHINTHSERRITLGGPTGGMKQVTYQVALVLLFRWVVPDGDSTAEGEPDGWADAYDELVDAVVARMRADRTFGSGPTGVIWQAGEGNNDIHLQTDLPRLDDDGGQVIVWSALEFECIEMVAT